MTTPKHPQTTAIRGANWQTAYNEHNETMFVTSSFTFDSAADGAALFAKEKTGFTYSRTANPTVTALQNRLAAMEQAEAGIATTTGMAAIQAAVMTFLSSGDHLVSSQSLFGTTAGFFADHLTRFGIEISYVAQTDLAQWRQAIKSNTKMFFVETPSNPLGEIADIQALADLAHQHDSLLAVDNCLCSPAVQQPLRHGADLSIQSATKAVDGQGRVLGGVVCGSTHLIQQVAVYANAAGISLSPFNAWVLLGGCETLHLRMQAQSQTAMAIAQWLQDQAVVKQVFYPGLPEHPQADLIRRQQVTGGSVLAVEIDGEQPAAWQVIDTVRLFSRTANFGDVKSTITHPWSTTHARMSSKEKLAIGITPGLIRLSIGLEHKEDLQADLLAAFTQL